MEKKQLILVSVDWIDEDGSTKLDRNQLLKHQ
jgi:hypothetical protein